MIVATGQNESAFSWAFVPDVFERLMANKKKEDRNSRGSAAKQCFSSRNGDRRSGVPSRAGWNPDAITTTLNFSSGISEEELRAIEAFLGADVEKVLSGKPRPRPKSKGNM